MSVLQSVKQTQWDERPLGDLSRVAFRYLLRREVAFGWELFKFFARGLQGHQLWKDFRGELEKPIGRVHGTVAKFEAAGVAHDITEQPCQQHSETNPSCDSCG